MKLEVKKSLLKDRLEIDITFKSYGAIDKNLINNLNAPTLIIKKGKYGAYTTSNLECNLDRKPNCFIYINEINTTLNEDFKASYLIMFDDIDKNNISLSFSSAPKLAEAYGNIFIELIKREVINKLNQLF